VVNLDEESSNLMVRKKREYIANKHYGIKVEIMGAIST
jgi:hypothetical protein